MLPPILLLVLIQWILLLVMSFRFLYIFRFMISTITTTMMSPAIPNIASASSNVSFICLCSYGYAYGLGLIHTLGLWGFVLELMVISLHGVAHLFHSEYDLMGTHEWVVESNQQRGFVVQEAISIVSTNGMHSFIVLLSSFVQGLVLAV